MKPDIEDFDSPIANHEFVNLEAKRVMVSDEKKRYSEGADFYRSWNTMEKREEEEINFDFPSKDRNTFYSKNINVRIEDKKFDVFFKKIDNGIREAVMRQKNYKHLFD